MPRPTTYVTLLAYLAARPPDEVSITLSLTEQEALVGPLPATALWDHMYWTNSAVAKRNWSRKGYRAQFSVRARVVTFTRRAGRCR